VLSSSAINEGLMIAFTW